MLKYNLQSDQSRVGSGAGWKGLLASVSELGYDASPRKLPTKEVLSLTYSLPLGRLEMRDSGNPAIGIVEGVGVISGAPWHMVKAALARVAPKTVAAGMFDGSMSDYAGRLDGFPTSYTFGADVLADRQFIGILAKNKEQGIDLPCTTSVQLRSRSGALHVNVSMRSQDLFLGLPADTMMWTIVGLYMAKQWGLEPGRLTFQVSAAHIYNKHLSRIEEPISEWRYFWHQIRSLESLLESLQTASRKDWFPLGLSRERVLSY